LKYCSKCGSENIQFKIPAGDNLKRYCCDDCGAIYYTNPNVVVGALCKYEDKVLLCKRNIQPRQGAIRETKEETQADINIIQPYTLFSLTHISQLHYFYIAELTKPKFGPTPESSEVALFTEEEIPWDEIAFPTVYKTLKHFFEDSKTNTFEYKEEEIKLG
jgi:ADP-ribose pyrophosphatase YjhB (NUDIX family)